MAGKKSNWTKGELEQLRNALPNGWEDTLADRANLKSTYVRNVLYGSAINDDLVIAALKLAEEWNEEIQLHKAKIAAL